MKCPKCQADNMAKSWWTRVTTAWRCITCGYVLACANKQEKRR